MANARHRHRHQAMESLSLFSPPLEGDTPFDCLSVNLAVPVYANMMAGKTYWGGMPSTFLSTEVRPRILLYALRAHCVASWQVPISLVAHERHQRETECNNQVHSLPLF